MKTTGIKTMCILCGEPSGDLYAGRLAEAVQRKYPEISIFGVGGDHLAGEHVRLIAHIKSLSFNGFTGVVRNLPVILKIRKSIFQEVISRNPEVIVMIDFPDFHISLAKKIKKHFSVLNQPAPVLIYYIPPQIWVWRKNRIRSIKRFFDAVIPVFSFEREIYEQHQIPVFFRGHPIIDCLRHQCQEKTETVSGIRIALLPGSRRQEITHILPLMLQSIQVYTKNHQSAHLPLQVLIPVVEHIGKEVYEKIISKFKIIYPEIPILMTYDGYQSILSSDLVLCKPGTNNLELAFFRKPFMVIYRTSFLNFLFISILVKIRFASLINLLSERAIVREFIQKDARPEAIAAEIHRLISDQPYRNKMLCGLDDFSDKIGLNHSGNVADQNAEFILSFVTSKFSSNC